MKIWGCLPFPGPAADHCEAVGVLAFARKQNVRAEHPISLRMRTLRALQDKRTDILWNDAQHRRLQSPFHIVNRLHARVEILNEKRETDAHNQSHDDSECNV